MFRAHHVHLSLRNSNHTKHVTAILCSGFPTRLVVCRSRRLARRFGILDLTRYAYLYICISPGGLHRKDLSTGLLHSVLPSNGKYWPYMNSRSCCIWSSFHHRARLERQPRAWPIQRTITRGIGPG
ncbi:hypothetical protein M404DRAFT_618213 [Pisolithus tinctorius Marx 270]|uniref:Uncharacterized protein n=1 Tax=Pisolithus tinctorius Marx 270 TaxID=870435 RepID=A0A0C3K1I3_PISTI|nr:hypothetical protein M404DRAFT_618213 [Pisolithus tinctorius Marx 270]